MVKYPSGHRLPVNIDRTRQLQLKNKSVNYGRRGFSLEDKINQSNDYYRERKIAVIHKKPTPIQIVKVDYPRRSAAKITEAYFRQASTTDFNGIYQGYYLDFETKETKNKTSFPLSNLPIHQLEHMEACFEQGGIVFILIYFVFHDEIYLLTYSKLKKFLSHTSQKSIPYDYIKDEAYLCPQGLYPMVDYLKVVNQLIK